MDERFSALIRSYLPDWQMKPDSGQSEAALLYAAWRLLEDTRTRMDQLPLKHEREFLNAWPMEAGEAEPMLAYAVLDAPEGKYVPAGSELYLSGSGSRLWRTVQPVCAESLVLQDQVLESSTRGKLLQISLPSEEIPTRLFDFRRDGQQRFAARFAQPDAFRSERGCQVTLHFPECDRALLDTLADAQKVRWMRERTDGTALEIDAPEREERQLHFALPADPAAVALIAEVRPGTAAPYQIAGRVLVSSRREEQSYTAAVSDDETTAEGRFLPFGLSPEPWRSCCIACPDVLGLRGAEILLTCTLTMTLREEKLPGMDKEPEYRSIMLRMPPPPPQVREVLPQSVVWEYWNGSAWLPVPGTRELTGLFGEGEGTRLTKARFRWPEDAALCQVQGQDGYWLRWRITRAEGFGYLPSRIHVPEIDNLHLCAVLDQVPVELSAYRGLDPVQLPVKHDRGSRLFLPPEQREDGWWLCFDHSPEEDRLSLYLRLAGRLTGSSLSAWESTKDGMKQLGLSDGTEGLSHSGLMLLSGIRGQQTERFCRTGWWLCFRDDSGRISHGYRYPQLTGLYPGTVCLRAEGGDCCIAGEDVKPLRGGALSGTTLTDSFGGTPAEDEEDMLIRAEKYRHHMGRGVSPLDVEQLVQFRFRDVVRTRSRRKESVVEVAVLMRDIHQHSAAFIYRREQITQLLEQHTAIPTLGLSLSVREPNFYPIQTTVWLRPGWNSDVQTDGEQVRQLLNQFFDPVTGKFRGDGWRIGDLPTEQELRNYLMMQMPQLALVEVLLTAVTPQGREVDCAGIHDPFALPVPGETVVHEVRGEDMR